MKSEQGRPSFRMIWHRAVSFFIPHSPFPIRTSENGADVDSQKWEARTEAMLYKLGRFLQLVGLVLLPVAIAGEVMPEKRLDLRQSLTLSAVGVLVFVLGWLLQQAGRAR
jgi:hypothetical protein